MRLTLLILVLLGQSTHDLERLATTPIFKVTGRGVGYPDK